MPEAVIVAAVRSPIGRAVKGSLAGVRPDDLATTIVRAALDQVPQLDPTELDDLHLGCGEPYDEHGAASPCSSDWTACPARPSTATAPRACRRRAWPCMRSRPAKGPHS